MDTVAIRVDAAEVVGDLDRIWRSFGYDELNWTYTPTGRYIFSQIRDLNDGPYWIRNHNAFTSGNGLSWPYWASTNCYTEDDAGRPHYDWAIIDRVYDVYVENNCKPMIELDFMPHDLSAFPETGPKNSWRYPPKDFQRWQELNHRFARHLIERYGTAEVRTWYFSSWNEPNIGYFRATPDEDRNDPEQRERNEETFFKLHDHTDAGIRAADPELRVGGPDVAIDPEYLDRFLNHCHNGTNYVTGETGTQLDFISVHAKGTGQREGKVGNPDFDLMARRKFLRYGEAIRKYPRFTRLPILANEWDIDVGTPYGIHDTPDFAYRNNAYFPVFVVRCMKELLDLKRTEGLNLELITQWTFYMHGMRCFEGTRAIFDPMGIRKPLFNAFAMLAKMGASRIAVQTDDGSADVAPGEAVGRAEARRPAGEAERDAMPPEDRVKPYPRVDGLAARDDGEVQVLVWHQVCDQYARGEREVVLTVSGLEGWRGVRLSHYRIDEDHSNAETVWRGLGRPDWPSETQIAAMKEKEALEKCCPDVDAVPKDGAVRLSFRLPMHSVSLITLRRPVT